jgi:ABC-type transporter Mla MlaB component
MHMQRNPHPSRPGHQDAPLMGEKLPRFIVEPDQSDGDRSLDHARRLTAAHEDLTGCHRVRDLLRDCRQALAQTRGALIVDLTEVHRADTKLVAAIVLIYRQAATRAIPIQLCVSDEVASLLRVCKLQTLLNDSPRP